MGIEGWYYLHTNGSLIYKRDFDGTVADIRESDFARALWPVDPSDRAGAWRILIEALALEADKSAVMMLADKWKCDDADAKVYAERVGVKLDMDGNAHCATRLDFVNLGESPAGFGDTALEAMADLCKRLGIKAGKMWVPTFADLVKVEN